MIVLVIIALVIVSASCLVTATMRSLGRKNSVADRIAAYTFTPNVDTMSAADHDAVWGGRYAN